MRRVDPSSIAIGVPCYREAARVPDLVAALRGLDPAPGALLAVDDGSNDGTAEALREADVDVVVHDDNQGLGAARNTLWRRAEELGFQAVAFIDADCIVPIDYLRKVSELLAGEGVAGVGGRNEERSEGNWIDEWRGRFWPQDLGPAPRMNAPWLVGACATYRVAALKHVGGFNPLFRTNGEDVDVGRRFSQHGLRLVYDPDVVVFHERRDRPEELVAMCYRHCRDGMRATVATPGGGGAGPRSLVLGMARKAVRAPAAALVKRKDPKEAALGVAACGAGLAGYVVGWAKPRPR
ncbi:MAG: glycosyltransferase family 2 protein [Proteobacteria bacterium]|nr:glycosyltransferase family 2 protein [Pseudomonadota bacterium]